MRKGHGMGRGAGFVALVCGLLLFATAHAQGTKSAKQAQSLEKAGDNAKDSVQTVLNNLKGVLTGYNAIVDGDAKSPESAYKKLVGDVKDADKSIQAAKKSFAALDKEADKFFKAWQQELESISSESIREKSTNRMELAKKRYASMGETLTQATEEFAPVMQNLNDQILFLGRDLSPDAVADLKDEAEELNRQAAEATAKVKTMLQSAGEAQSEAEAELEGA